MSDDWRPILRPRLHLYEDAGTEHWDGGFTMIGQDARPHDEAKRLAAVRRYNILDTPPDGSFDRITSIAARRFNVPISIISVVDQDRIWFKSHYGTEVGEVVREPGLCASAIMSPGPYVVEDAKHDPRSLANSLVASGPGFGFYAAAPLVTASGYGLGTLCVIDVQPRKVDQALIDDLSDLASVVMDQLELRLSARKALDRAQLMAREIDHRVMNSLQFVSSLLKMQSRTARGDTAVQLKNAANRLAAVAHVHRNFYTEPTDRVSCVSFLKRLCSELSTVLGKQITVSGDEDSVPTTWIQPIGLIVNELLTNGAKHGGGSLAVEFRSDGQGYRLSVSDGGKGLPADYDFARSTGLGMKVLKALSVQLDGDLSIGSNREGTGVCATVTWPCNS
jgi:two-component sensor histidine kinase